MVNWTSRSQPPVSPILSVCAPFGVINDLEDPVLLTVRCGLGAVALSTRIHRTQARTQRAHFRGRGR